MDNNSQQIKAAEKFFDRHSNDSGEFEYLSREKFLEYASQVSPQVSQISDKDWYKLQERGKNLCYNAPFITGEDIVALVKDWMRDRLQSLPSREGWISVDELNEAIRLLDSAVNSKFNFRQSTQQKEYAVEVTPVQKALDILYYIPTNKLLQSTSSPKTEQ